MFLSLAQFALYFLFHIKYRTLSKRSYVGEMFHINEINVKKKIHEEKLRYVLMSSRNAAQCGI